MTTDKEVLLYECETTTLCLDVCSSVRDIFGDDDNFNIFFYAQEHNGRLDKLVPLKMKSQTVITQKIL